MSSKPNEQIYFDRLCDQVRYMRQKPQSKPFIVDENGEIVHKDFQPKSNKLSSGSWFRHQAFPYVQRVHSKSLAEDIVPVQPITGWQIVHDEVANWDVEVIQRIKNEIDRQLIDLGKLK